MGNRRAVVCLALLFATSGCASPQEAEPVATSVPVAGGLAAAIGAALWFVVRSAWRRVDRSTTPHPSLDGRLRYPRVTAAALLAPLLSVGLLILAAGCWEVAIGYVESHEALLSWEDTLWLTGMGAVVLTILTAVVGAIAVAVASRRRSTRSWGRTVLVLLVVIGGGLTHGVLLVWAPALALSFLVEPGPAHRLPTGSTTFSMDGPRH